MMSVLKKFFASTEGSIKGFLSPEELYRSILTSIGSGSSIGLVILLLQAILSNADSIFPNPTVASLVTALLTLVLDLLRRQAQGSKPAPAPAAIPVAHSV